MTDRWRQPVKLVGVESSTDTMRIGDRVYRDYEYLMRREDWERICAGYVCIQCLEPHEQAWPERCPLCGTTAEQQRERLPVEFYGTVHLADDVDDEIEMLKDTNARKMHRPTSSIVLPRGVTVD